MKKKYTCALCLYLLMLTGCSKSTETSSTAQSSAITYPKFDANVPTRDTSIGKSDKSVDVFRLVPERATVTNDVTHRWRYSRVYEANVDFTEYAASYYDKFFQSSEEIHAVINMRDNTTTKIMTFDGKVLIVTVMRHIDNEEYDAKTLFSGDALHEYSVYLDNGDIELIY